MKLCVVIPTYNEGENVENLVSRLKLAISVDHSLIFIDDASPDGTADVLDSLADPRVQIIRRAGKLGLGSAYLEGFRRALELGAQYIVQMDADLSHQPEAIADLIQKSGGADLVIGSRYVPGGRIDGWSWRRHAASRGAMLFSRTLLGLSARDVTSGFRLWRADLLAAILVHPIASNGYAFQEEMLYRAQRAGGRIVEVPITFVDRVSGASKLHWRDVAEFFSVMIKLKLYDREK